MKRQILVLLVLIFGLSLKGQDLPLYSQYTLNPYLMNPSIAGIAGCGILQAVNRTQWTGIQDAPYTYAVSYHQRLGQVGLGGYVSDDKNGLTQNLGFQFTFAYHVIKNTEDKSKQLSFGISFCGAQHSIDQTKFLAIENDPIASGTLQSFFAFNANAGMYYIHRNFFAGLSVANLFSTDNSITKSKIEPTNLRNYFFQFGYSFYLKTSVVLEPSALVKTTESFNKQVDTNLKLVFLTSAGYRIWFAASYRRNMDNSLGTSNSFMPIICFSGTRFSFAYAFDYSLTSIGRFASGSHEIMIGYTFCNLNRSETTCPAYKSYNKWQIRKN